jgi:DNA polymerase elongation subunit (family B)
MLDKIIPEDVLFIDIETVSQTEKLDQLPAHLQKLWIKKASQIAGKGETEEELFSRSGIYAEFGKIVCISAGKIYRKGEDRIFRVKSFYGSDEPALLKDFLRVLENFMANPQHRICAHNGQEFDFPYIARRTLINGLKLPPVFDIAGAKPWEIRECLLDTLQLWKFGDYKHYTSLDLLCTIFNIPTPKDDIDGSQVGDVFYKEADYTRIARYCEKDTLAVAQLLLRYKGDPIIPQENFEIV